MLFKFSGRKKQSKNKLSPDKIECNNKWNKMWALWAEGKIESPYNELMSYHGEVNNGGHYQFFSNADNIENSDTVVEMLSSILSEDLKHNLKMAYRAYINLENNIDIDSSEQDIEKCDNIFYENEDKIIKMLESYSEQF